MKELIILTKIVGCLFGFTLAIFNHEINDGLPSETPPPSIYATICFYQSCLETATNFIKNMNTDIEPCDDFYEFACGKFITNSEIPNEERYINHNTKIKKSIIKEMSLKLNNTMNTTMDGEEKHYELLKTLYSACMNSPSFKDENILLLSRLGVDWPVFQGDAWNETAFDWQNVTSILDSRGFKIDYLFKLSVEIDAKDPSEYIITIDQPVLEFPREYFSEMKYINTYVDAYKKYMTDIAINCGVDKEIVETEVEDVIYFELDLASIILPHKQRRNMNRLYNKMDIHTLTFLYPSIFSKGFLNNILPLDREVNLTDRIIVKELQYLKDLENRLKVTKKRVLANYIFWKSLVPLVPFLSEELRRIQYTFINSITGQLDRDENWAECLKTSKNYMPLAFGAVYIRYVYPDTPKDEVYEMLHKILRQLKKNIFKMKWVDLESKHEIFNKIDSISFTVGHPEEFYNNELLANYYETLEFKSGMFVEQILELNLFYKKKMTEMMNSKVDVNTWYNHPYAAFVNAYYYYDRNQIELPSAVLQGMVYDPYRPHYLNYGALGFVMGHEMVHALDDIGRQYDHNSSLTNWWSANTTNNFEQRAKCLEDQYTGYEIPEVFGNVDGYATLSENIADNGGVRAAYWAYQELVKIGPTESNWTPEELLPAMNYTMNQLFWISFANVHCTKYRIHELYNVYRNDIHSLPKFRVNGVVRNMVEFAADFRCPEGSNMYPEERCIVW